MQYKHAHVHTHMPSTHSTIFKLSSHNVEAHKQAHTYKCSRDHSTIEIVGPCSQHSAQGQTVNHTLLPLPPDLLAGERAAKCVQVDSGNRCENSNNTGSCKPVPGRQTDFTVLTHTYTNVR